MKFILPEIEEAVSACIDQMSPLSPACNVCHFSHCALTFLTQVTRKKNNLYPPL